MSSIIVELDSYETELFTNAAAEHGLSISALIKKLSREKLEDNHDLAIIREYEAAKANGTLKTRPIEELRKECLS